MFNLGGAELLVILLLALIVLGPQRLPDAARQVGKLMGELRRLSSGFQNEMRNAFDADDNARPPTELRPVHEPIPPDSDEAAENHSSDTSGVESPAPLTTDTGPPSTAAGNPEAAARERTDIMVPKPGQLPERRIPVDLEKHQARPGSNGDATGNGQRPQQP